MGSYYIDRGNLPELGQPDVEIYLESLRYLAGKTANSNFNVANDVLLPASPTWTDPLSTQNSTAPRSMS